MKKRYLLYSCILFVSPQKLFLLVSGHETHPTNVPVNCNMQYNLNEVSYQTERKKIQREKTTRELIIRLNFSTYNQS